MSDLEQQWRDAADWWTHEGASDPVYRETVLPLLERLLPPADAGPILDLGCGEGSVAAALHGRSVIGVDLTAQLLAVAQRTMPVVRARLPHLAWVRPGAVEGALCVLTLEHLPDLDAFFTSVRTAVAPGGFLVVVSNHPAYTAAGAGPLIDLSDGEVLWRWGPYFALGVSEEPVGGGSVTFHHRPLGTILTAAAGAGWRLDEVIEVPLDPAAIARDPGYAGQEHLPRLYAARWLC